MFTAKVRLSADDGRIVTKALQLAAKQLQAERGELGPDTTTEQLLADALVALASSFLATGLAERAASDEYRIVVFADDTIIEPEPAPRDENDDDCCGASDRAQRASQGDAPRAHLDGGTVLSAETIRRIWCDTSITRIELRDGVIVAISEPGQAISAALRRALRLRDGQCRFPGCSAKRIDAHHIRYRRHHGPTTLTNLLSLCRFHHRLIHEGGYTIGRGTNGELRFYDPRGRQLHNRSALVANGGADALRRHHRDLGIDIGPDTIIGNHHGDHLDLAYATSVLTRPNVPPGTHPNTN